MNRKFKRLADLIAKQYKKVNKAEYNVPFVMKFVSGDIQSFGEGNPVFAFQLNNEQAIAALSTLDQQTITEAYLAGHLDITGDIMQVLALREMFKDNKPLRFIWRFIRPILFGQVKSDKKWIANHYDIEEEFFLLFLDQRHRAYSQAVFANDKQSLEDAQTCKLDFALDAVNVHHGDHILDIGSGWGAFVSFAGKKGMKVTSITISERSKSFVEHLIEKEKIPCTVLLEHFIDHYPSIKYDAIVNCGVTEHLPDYKASLKHYAAILKPGGYLYLDASADRVKNSHGSFMSKFVFEGNASLLCLHEFLAEVAQSPFQLCGVWDDRHNYYLTTKKWAERLDQNREYIEQKWGKQLYRIFQLYLWGSAQGFHSGMIDAYRVVLRLK